MLRPSSSGYDLDGLRARTTGLLHLHRRTVSAVLAALGLVLAINAARPHAPATDAVWVAARDLAGGRPLAASDVRLAQLPRDDLPSGSLSTQRSPVGRILGAPVRRGEPLTDLRVISTTLIAASGAPGDLAVPIRVTDGPATLALVKAGEHVAVIVASDPTTGVTARARTVVEDVRVLALPSQLTSDDSGLIIVAATRRQAAAIAEIPAGDRVSVAVRQ